MNKKTVIRLIWNILILFFLFGFALALYWYTQGSFEMVPTEEQQEKAQMAAIFSMIVTGIPCIICAVVRSRIK